MQPTVGVLVSALRYRWCHRSFEETTAWPTAADRYRYTSPKGRELRAAVLDGVLLRLGRAGSKALGPRRASSLAGLGARGLGRFLSALARVTIRCRRPKAAGLRACLIVGDSLLCLVLLLGFGPPELGRYMASSARRDPSNILAAFADGLSQECTSSQPLHDISRNKESAARSSDAGCHARLA